MATTTSPLSIPQVNDPRIAAAEAWANEEANKAQIGTAALQRQAQDAARQGDSEGYQLIRNFAAGWTESTNHAAAAIFGGLPRMVGELTGSQGLASTGKGIEDFFTENIQHGPQPTRAAMGTGQWSDVWNPAYFSYNLGALSSSVAQMVTPGAALKAINTFRAGVPALIKAARAGEVALDAVTAERGLRWGRAMANVGASADELASVATEIGVRPDVFAKAVKASRPLFDDPAALQAFGAKIGAVEAAHIQGYGTYKRIKEAGGNEAEALAGYAVMGTVAGKLDLNLLTRWFGEFPPDLKGRLINAAATVGTNAAIPVADLVTQWGATLGGDVPNPAALATISSTLQTIQAGLGPSALLGMVVGNGYSKRDRLTDVDPVLQDPMGEPAHGALGFVGKRDALFSFYGTDKTVSGHRVKDQGDGTFLVEGSNGEPSVTIPYQKVKSVYTKNNVLGEEGSLLWEDNPDTNPLAGQILGDELIKEMGIQVDRDAKRQREALERRARRAEVNRLAAEDLATRLDEVKNAPEGERRTKAIDAVLENLGSTATGLLGKALQPATNRAALKGVEQQLAQATSELEALQRQEGVAGSPEGPILLNTAEARVKTLTAKRDFLNLMHDDMLQALGTAGEAASILGGKRAAQEMGRAAKTDPEKVETVRKGLEEQISTYEVALSQTQGLPPGTDLRLQAEQGLREAQGALALFDRFRPLDEAHAEDLVAPSVPGTPAQGADTTQALADLGYTPEEVRHLQRQGRAEDVVNAGLERPVTFGAGVRDTVAALREAGVSDAEMRSLGLTGARANAAETALRLLPQGMTEAVFEQVSPERVALETARRDHAELVTARTSMMALLDQIRPDSLSTTDPTNGTLAELRGALEATEAQIATLQKDFPELKVVPKTVAAGVPGVGVLRDDPTVVDPVRVEQRMQPWAVAPTGSEVVRTTAPHLERARAILPSLPENLSLFLEEAIDAVETGNLGRLTPEGEMFRSALLQHQNPNQLARVLGETMLTFKEFSNITGETFQASTIEAIARALGVQAREGANFGLSENTGPIRLFQTGSPQDIINRSVERFNSVAEIPDLKRKPSLVKKLLRGELSPLEVAASLLEARGRLVVEPGTGDGDVPVLELQLTHTKRVDREATVQALSRIAFAIQEGLGAALGKTYSPTILTADQLPLMGSDEWSARFHQAMEPGAWLSDFRDNLRKAREESGAVIRGEEEVTFLKLFHGMMEHAAAVQGIPAEAAARKWLESRAGSGTRPYAKDAFFGIIGAPEGMEQVLEGKRGARRVKTLNQEVPLEQTQQFKNWFKSSKVVNAEGKPLVVYHGTNADFSTFQIEQPSTRQILFSERTVSSQGHFFSPSLEDAQSYGKKVIPVYLSIQNPLTNPAEANVSSRMSKQERAGHLKLWEDVEYILEPVIYERDGSKWIDMDGGVSALKVDSAGEWISKALQGNMVEWDWLDNPDVVKRMHERGYDGAKVTERNDASGESWFVLNSNQIKAAQSNSGAFDPSNPNILMQQRGNTTKGWFDVFEGPEGPRGLITLTRNADFTTLVEEMAHFTRTTLSGTNYAKVKASVNAFLKEKGLPAIRTEGGYDVWTRDAEEVFAKWTLAALKDAKSKEIPAPLRSLLEQTKPMLESLWDSTLDVYGSPPPETRAQLIRLFNPLLPRMNATGKMVGVRIREQATKHGVNQFTATFYTPEQVEAAGIFARGTEGTEAVYEANKTSREEMFAKVAEWQKMPEEAQRRINAALSVGGTPEPSLILYQAIQAASDAIPAVEALLSARTDKQRREAKAQLDNLPSLLMKKRSSVAAGQALWAHSLDPISTLLNAQNGVLQLSKQMSASDVRRLFQDIEDARGGDMEALKRVTLTMEAGKVETPQLGDYFKQLVYAGMMMNPRIHTTNAVMIGVMAGLMKLPLKATAALVDAGWSYASGKPREIFFREIGVNRKALKVGIRRGLSGFADILQHGLTDDPLDNARKLTDADKYTQHQLAFEHTPDVVDVPFLGKKAWGEKLRKIAPYITFGSNFAHGVDFMLRSVVYHDNLWQLSMRRALAEGAADPHLIANRLMKRAMDGTMDTETLRKEAGLLAFQATGGDEPGTFTKKVIEAKNSFGVMAVPFMPFVNTLANLMKRSAELVPGVGYGLWRSQVKEQLGKDSPTFYVDKPQEMIGKQVFGGLMGLVLASMFHHRDEDGLPEITGVTPMDAGERDFWRRNGIIPYSVRVGGRYIQFSRVDPVGMVLMGAANVADSWAHYQAAQSDPRLAENASAYKVTEQFLNTMFRDVLNNSYASNFFRLADKEGSNSQEVLRSLSSLVPFSGVLRQIATTAWQAQHGGEYVAPDVGPALGAVLGIVPWAWAGLDVQPRRDAFGEPIVYRAQNAFVNWFPVQVSAGNELDPVEKELRRLSVYPTVPLPDKRIRLVPNGEEFDVPVDLWNQMVTEFGIRGKEELAKIIERPGYKGIQDGTMQGVLRQAQMLDRVLDKVRGRYTNWLKGEMGKRLQAGLLEKPLPLAERQEVYP